MSEIKMIKIISEQEKQGIETTMDQVKEALAEMGRINYDELDRQEKLQLSDTLQVCAYAIGTALAFQEEKKVGTGFDRSGFKI